MLFRRFTLLSIFALAALAQKRPITHADYDGFRSIASARLSNDGKWVVYGLFPQAGDGAAILRSTTGAKEHRFAAGQRPEPVPPEPGSETPPAPRGLTSEFTSDGKWVVFQTYPSRADLEKARKEKKRPADMPKGGLSIINVETGAEARIANVKSFQVPDSDASTIAYLKENGELVVRTLADGKERTAADVAEYKLTDDASTVVYLAKTGAFTWKLSGDPAAIHSGSGKYTKLAASEGQTRFAYLKDSELHAWSPGEASATVLVTNAATAATPSFSDDGARLFYGIPVRETPAAAKDDGEEKAGYDLWHYRDDFVQPMQRVRARQERDRSYRAVYDFAAKKSMQLADAALPEVAPSRGGDFTTGADDRAYRRLVEQDTRYADVYSIDLKTGKRLLLGRKVAGSPSISPDGKWVMTFEDKHWVSYDTATGERRVLTAIAGRNFYREDDDHPAAPPAYGGPQWTKDSKFALVPDRFDVWQLAPDGSLARNLTDGVGRRENVQLRVVRFGAAGPFGGGAIAAADSRERGLDPAQPLILAAEHVETHQSGFYRDSLDEAEQPRKLHMAARNFGVPGKAKNADTLVVTASRFDEFPDLQVTDLSFASMTKISNANPQMAELAWGSAELIRYRNGDGAELSAALYKPANFDPAKKYPMIVYIYEKLAQQVHGFVEPRPGHSINASYYTSNGYVVLMPDIIYEVGYPGASALRCVSAAVEKVVDMGFVDSKRIGIQGHSWGGYQIAYMLTRTNRFRAAAPGALVANMISAYSGIRWGPGLPRQFQYEKGQSRIGGSPWQEPMRYIENSPIFMADRVETPVLMLHNDADDAVPWYQGIEFFLALRRLNKEAYMFVYNGEPHGIRKRPNQRDYTVRLQEFFDYHLKDAPKPAWMERGRPFIEKEPRGSGAPSAAATDDQP